jgi:hypothetical protein
MCQNQVRLELPSPVEYVEINLYQFFSPHLQWTYSLQLHLLEYEKANVADQRGKGHMQKMHWSW